MTAPRPHKASGFTLLEIMVALFLFSLISVGSMTALVGSSKAAEQMETRLDDIADIQTAYHLIRSDFDALILRPHRDILGAQDTAGLSLYDTRSENALIRFTRTGRTNPGGLAPRGDLQVVSYHIINGNLVRRLQGHENPAQNTGFVDRVLLTDVQAADLTAYKNLSPINATTLIDNPNPDIDYVALVLKFDDGREFTTNFELGL